MLKISALLFSVADLTLTGFYRAARLVFSICALGCLVFLCIFQDFVFKAQVVPEYNTYY